MFHRTLVALTLGASMLLIPACQSQQQSRPKQQPYEQLSPLENNDDPFANADQPSLQGLDRSNWPVMTYSVPDAGLGCLPAYFKPVPLGADRKSPLQSATVDQQLAKAMSGSCAGNWNSRNTREAFAGPIWAGVDVVMLPVRMVQR